MIWILEKASLANRAFIVSKAVWYSGDHLNVPLPVANTVSGAEHFRNMFW
jgi:hypothetical protein